MPSHLLELQSIDKYVQAGTGLAGLLQKPVDRIENTGFKAAGAVAENFIIQCKNQMKL
jgi:hypothetical protein